MFEFGVRNLRRLRQPSTFEIRPITILVGRNSSGKSTFLRSLPLLRQSIITRTSSPILWYGDSVDFGSFDKSVYGNASGNDIVFDFGLDRIDANFRNHIGNEEINYFIYRRYQFLNVKLGISIRKHKEGTRISSITLEESSNQVKFRAVIGENQTVTSLMIDDVEMSPIFLEDEIVISEGSILPTASFRPKNIERRRLELLRRGSYFRSVQTALTKILKPRLDKRTTDDTLRRLETQLLNIGKVTPESIKSEFGNNKNRSWTKLINDICGRDSQDQFASIRRLALVVSFVTILNSASSELRNIISSSLYIGPARARSERYYRYQDLSVSEIDPDGKNFAMFLNSLSPKQIQNFSEWVKSIFDYGVTVSKESGHISINITSDAGEVNVVDTGYGVSQVLPVLGQIWYAANRPRQALRKDTYSPTIISIEQPELHLHPAHQALLADTLMRSYQQSDSRGDDAFQMHFIVETHSEALVNRLGELIGTKQLLPEHVQILVFEPDDADSKATTIKVAVFDENGFLSNWPHGFFLPRV